MSKVTNAAEKTRRIIKSGYTLATILDTGHVLKSMRCERLASVLGKWGLIALEDKNFCVSEGGLEPPSP